MNNVVAQVDEPGRDVEEKVYALCFIDGVWTADGGELLAAASKVTERKLGGKMCKVLELVNSRSQTTAADVVIHIGISHSTARQHLRRLADEHGLITRLTTGAYGPVTVSQVSRNEDRDGSPDEEPADSGTSDEVSEVVPTSQCAVVLSDTALWRGRCRYVANDPRRRVAGAGLLLRCAVTRQTPPRQE